MGSGSALGVRPEEHVTVGSGLTGGGLTDGVGVGGIAVGDGGLGRTHGRKGGSVDVEGVVRHIVKQIKSGFVHAHVVEGLADGVRVGGIVVRSGSEVVGSVEDIAKQVGSEGKHDGSEGKRANVGRMDRWKRVANGKEKGHWARILIGMPAIIREGDHIASP